LSSSRLVVVAILLLLGGLAAKATPLEDLQACVTQVQSQESSAHKLIELCPNIAHSLAALGLDRQIEVDANQKPNLQVLEDIDALARRYAGSPAARVPSTAALASIAEGVNGKKTEPQRTWWDRFKDWVQQWFSDHAPSDKGWLDAWLKRLGKSQQLLNVLFYLCMGLVVVAALGLIINELRAANWLRNRRQNAPDSSGMHLQIPADFDAAQARSGIAQLLGFLVVSLVATGRLRAERTLTHRELVKRSVFDNDEQHRVFASVALGAEALMYGARGPDTSEHLMQQGNALLAQIAESPMRDRP
jgi:hypothetical protein